MLLERSLAALPIPLQNPGASMRWLRMFGIALLLAGLFLAGAFYSYRAIARKQQRDLRADLLKLPDPARGTAYPKVFFQRGVNFTAEFPAFYGSDRAVEMLKKLPGFGVDSIALVPYGFASTKEPQVRGWNTRWEGDAGITQLARVAHSLGMRVLLKPQLWMHSANPANIDFPDAAARAEWFRQYRPFLEHYAGLGKEIHADGLCVGVELEKMTPYEQEWRSLITRAREIYPGPLTYAANFGSEFETIKFWDALDWIGLDEYYALPENLSAAEIVQKIEAVQRHYQKPVVFTEAGFPSVEGANRTPWDEPAHRVDLQAQAQCYEALYRAFYKQPWFVGIYWWKVGTNGFGGEKDASHTPWNKPAMEVVREWYTSGKR
jgi:hypothetical protein